MSSPDVPPVPQLDEEKELLLRLARDFAQRVDDYERMFLERVDDLSQRITTTTETLSPTLRTFAEEAGATLRTAAEAGRTGLQRLAALTAVPLEVREREARMRAAADVVSTAEKARQQTMASLARRGLDPSQVAATGLDRSLRAAAALQAAQAANTAALQARRQQAELAALQTQLGGTLANIGSTGLARAGALDIELARLAGLPVETLGRGVAAITGLGDIAARSAQQRGALQLGVYQAMLGNAQLEAESKASMWGGIGSFAGNLIGATIGALF